jgi:hypothetical protein
MDINRKRIQHSMNPVESFPRLAAPSFPDMNPAIRREEIAHHLPVQGKNLPLPGIHYPPMIFILEREKRAAP